MTAEALVAVLSDTRAMLARPDNDFSWSRWRDQVEATGEIDRILEAIAGCGTVKLLPIQMLFAPTGSLQEVSIESGWGDEFLQLAARFDEAICDL